MYSAVPGIDHEQKLRAEVLSIISMKRMSKAMSACAMYLDIEPRKVQYRGEELTWNHVCILFACMDWSLVCLSDTRDISLGLEIFSTISSISVSKLVIQKPSSYPIGSIWIPVIFPHQPVYSGFLRTTAGQSRHSLIFGV